ncbi:MAG: 1-deoxy-D-xylulose-5-phosphate synthase [Bacteroidales bacterium]|nr:1-deoxy-D-xylulose-5-phosphate synthase [Bacteroidales bacterium]
MEILENKWLDRIDYPTDLRALPPEALVPLCAELRQYIIDVLSENPGHFASSLGTVELTVALHYVFNTPFDRIVWDVGHQAYTHKILTGRKALFPTLRKWNGISGFPNPEESEYDAFIAGHASNSISAALGMAVASRLKDSAEDEHQVIAVLGDGSMTGGLAYEGLNNTSSNPNNLLIILNDNNMAIDHNVGGISEYLVDITTSHAYNKMRYDVYRALRKFNIITEDRRASILRFNNSLKALLTNQHNLFEGLSIRYFGPVDGHDVHQLVRVLKDIRHLKGPKLLHIRTVKGKGFKPAEESATEWHAPGKFNKTTGVRLCSDNSDLPSLYQDVFGNSLLELAREDKRIVGITPAMPTGCSLSIMMKEIPERTFDVGIAESHAVTFSAGLAKEGLVPFCNIYSSFMQRAYDQIIHDVAMQRLPVIFCLDRAGLVGEDGVTHHGYFDLCALRSVPNLTIASPINELDLRNLMYTASQFNGPFVLRYPRGRGVLKDWRKPFEKMPVGKGRKLADGKDIAVLSIGHIGNYVAKAIEQAKEKGVECAHYDMIFLKPLDEELLMEVGRNYSKIITVENGMISGGLGSAVLEFMSDRGFSPKIRRIGIPDQFVQHGTIADLERFCKMDVPSILEAIMLIKEDK